MITLKSSSSDGSSYQVYEDDRLIGSIIKHKGLPGDRYRASINRDGREESSEREFDASHEALQRIDKRRPEFL
jgi:hypothetical protein